VKNSRAVLTGALEAVFVVRSLPVRVAELASLGGAPSLLKVIVSGFVLYYYCVSELVAFCNLEGVVLMKRTISMFYFVRYKAKTKRFVKAL